MTDGVDVTTGDSNQGEALFKVLYRAPYRCHLKL